MKKYLPAFLFIVTIFLLASCSGGNEKVTANSNQKIAVTIASPSVGAQQNILASGQIESAQTANISTRMMGRITHIYVKAGDKVSKGQLLATISDEDVKAKRSQTEAMIAEAEAAYVSTQKDYDRFNNLYKQQSATAKELDNATLQYNAAKARVDAAMQMRNEVNAMLSYSNLIAPFAGVVTQKLSEAGNISSPGMPILTIEQNGILQVSASVAESDISQVHIGDAANVEVKSTGKNFEGKIIQINPSSQFTGGQYIIKVSIPVSAKADLYAGMFVNVSIPLKKIKAVDDDIISVPLSAIVNRDELTGIYTVSNQNTALLRWIRLGKTDGDKAEVISGMSKDEKFILSSESKLYNGAPVDVR